jgi:hypothetical protein
MDQEEKELLGETLELEKENNQMLRKIRGVQKRQILFSVLKGIFIVGIALGVFYFLEPFLNKAMNVFTGFSGLEKPEEEGKVENDLIQNILKGKSILNDLKQ